MLLVATGRRECMYSLLEFHRYWSGTFNRGLRLFAIFKKINMIWFSINRVTSYYITITIRHDTRNQTQTPTLCFSAPKPWIVGVRCGDLSVKHATFATLDTLRPTGYKSVSSDTLLLPPGEESTSTENTTPGASATNFAGVVTLHASESRVRCRT